MIGAEAATPAGKAGQSRPWTEPCEGSGSAPARGTRPPGAEIPILFIKLFILKKDYRETQNPKSFSTV
ncbi:hypothetical protein AM499_06380 [Bacillus sp. FJAT-22090]|nr:hypothetical protein AM499_06380 [Bacillus sp. FJAT-22090]